MKAVRGALVTIAILAGCLVAAFAVANLVDTFRPGTLLHGRNVIRVAMLVSALIFIATLLRRRSVAWRQVFIELAIIEAVMAALIWQFSGAVSFGTFFLSWWLGVNLCVVLPWFVATVIRRIKVM